MFLEEDGERAKIALQLGVVQRQKYEYEQELARMKMEGKLARAFSGFEIQRERDSMAVHRTTS